MEISVIGFTENGIKMACYLSDQVKGKLNGCQIHLYGKCNYLNPLLLQRIDFVESSIIDWAREQMHAKHIILFIGAVGIAVRAIAPWITDKLSDQPVLVMDETAKFVIPILSGHVGGANDLARQIAHLMGAEPVITTATDLCDKFAIDLFAKRNDLVIQNKDGIAKVTSKVLAKERITMSVENGHLQGKLPENINCMLVSYPPKEAVDVLIASEKGSKQASLWLSPKEYLLGMGCKKGKDIREIKGFVDSTIKQLRIREDQILGLASVDLKKEEKGFLLWCEEKEKHFFTYTAKELSEVDGEFTASEFVNAKVGIDNVCERAAIKACGGDGQLILRKTGCNGMTIAIAKRKWKVTFENE